MARYSRRQFLKHAGAALGASVLAPYVVPSAARGADGAVAPSERITMGILGTGGRGRTVLSHFLRQSDVQWIAACDCFEERLRRAKQQVDAHYKTADCATHRDFREMIARSDLDALLIATGSRWHAIASIYAARAGKDMYCEKPISLTIGEGRTLIETCARLGTIYQAGYQRHSVDSFRFQVEVVRKKLIGDLKTIICSVWETGVGRQPVVKPVPPGFDYEMWLGPTPWHPYTDERVHGWRDYWDTAGGIICDMGSHWTDLAQWGNDTEATGPVAIEGTAEWTPQAWAEIPPRCEATLTYRNGVKCILRSRGGFTERYIRFVGTDGWIQVDDETNLVTAEPKSILTMRGISARGWGDPGDHVRNFLQGVKTRQRTVCHPESAHRAMSVPHLANICLRLGRPLAWGPDTETFPNDAEANRMISRAMRPPWRI